MVTLLGLVLLLSISAPTSQPPVARSYRIVNVGMALATGGLGDRAFSDSAYAGLLRAQRDFGTRFRVVEFHGGAEQVTALRHLAQEQPDLIIAVGSENTAALKQVAAEYPQQAFALLDGAVEAPNVTAVTFCELEGDFLAGALAALLSPDGTVGFLGGADIPIIRRIESGWTQGVQYVIPQARILSQYVGGPNDFSGFGKPDVGLELTLQMYREGAAVVYAAAGRTGLGAIEAARQSHALIITTGADQRWLGEEAVVTSRTKNMDVAVYSLITGLREGTLRPGAYQLDYRSGGVGFAPLNESLMTPEALARFNQIRQALEADQISVAGECTP